MRVTTLALALVAAVLLLSSAGCSTNLAQQGAGQAQQDAGQAQQDPGQAQQDTGQAQQDAGQAQQDTGQAQQDTGQAQQDTGQPGQDTGQPGQDTGETGPVRPDSQAGEYAKAFGYEVPAVAIGTTTYILRQGVGAARKERDAHSSSYLPRNQGPLAKEKDAQIAGDVLAQVNRCDLFRDEIEQAAHTNLPTSKKFDKAIEALTGYNPDYTSYYLTYHYEPTDPGWTGLCHNWAPAGVLDGIEPMVWSSDMIAGDQPTGLGDFREMVTAMLPTVDNDLIGRRNNTMVDEDEDTDLDFADVVASLAYAIQDHDYGIIFDITSTAQVWNQPVDEYTQEVTDGSGDAAVSGLIPPGGTAKRVRLTIPYVVEAGYAHRGATYRGTMNLEGFLIENSAGKVVDSKWGTPTRDHPDFMWVPTGLRASAHYQMLKGLFHQGTRMEHVQAAADLCDKVNAFAQTIKQGGTPSQADRNAVKGTLANASKVIDSQKLDSFITAAASSASISRNALAAAVTSP